MAGLDLSRLNQLKTLFDNNHWEISEEDENTVFQRFCERASLFNDDELDLLIKLTSRFLRIEYADYVKHLYECISLNSLSFPENEIIIVPLLSDKDLIKVKSSGNVAYLFNDLVLKKSKQFIGKNTKVKSVLEIVNDFKKNKSNARFLLVDDFVGSGNTAVSCIRYIVNNSKITIAQITVISIVAMRSGVNLVSALGVNLFASQVIDKGISDYFEADKAKEYLNVMVDMEKKISSNKTYTLGYEQSEALVKMIRTPNNTFPIFWHENSKSRAPFPRH